MIKLINRQGAQMILPATIIFKRVPLAIDVPSQPLYGRDGAVKTGKSTIQPRQFSLEGRIYYPDRARIRQELDELLPFLMQAPIEVYRHHEDTRCLTAYPLGAPQDWIDEGAELELQVPMIALDPYWYGPEVTVTVTGTQAIEVGGSAPTFPVVRTEGAEAAVTVTNTTTGQSIVITGLSVAGVIEIDCANFTVTVGGAGALDHVNESWFASGFELRPGENEITTTKPIELVYRPQWY